MEERVLHIPGASFACMNGGKGFVSYFDGILGEYRYIYVIKGGPGTGKSRLMREIAKKRAAAGEQTKIILCSSDPSSLDGLLLPDRGIALVDGTSPHAREPKTPCVDGRIVDLLAFADRDTLLNNKETILRLCAEKSEAYRRAYSLLSAAERTFDARSSLLKERFDAARFEKITSKLEKRGKKAGVRRVLPYKAFCSQGILTLDTPCEEAREILTVLPFYGGEYLLLDLIARQIGCMISPDPVCTLPDSLIIEDHGTLIRRAPGKEDDQDDKNDKNDNEEENGLPDRNEKHLRAGRFFKLDKETRAALRASEKIGDALQRAARDELKKAASAHFAVEKIYTSAMNFKNVCEITQKIDREIAST